MNQEFIFQTNIFSEFKKYRTAFETLYGRCKVTVRGNFDVFPLSRVAFMDDKFHEVLWVDCNFLRVKVDGEIFTINALSDHDNGKICFTALSE